MATMTNLVNCNNNNDPFRRRLRRGETSLVGITGDEGTVRMEERCHENGGNVNIQYEEEEEEMEEFVDGVTGQFSGSVVVMEGEEDESQQLSREEEEDMSNVLAETRVDGVVDPSSVILRSAPLPPPSEEEENAAYNYWSTQSQVKEAKSTRTQPSVPQTNNIIPKSIATYHHKKFRNGNNTPSTNCHVIQGQITLFIAHNADPFENLDGRIRDAIKDELSNERVLRQEFFNEEIVGIRLLKPLVVDGEESLAPPISVVAVTAPPSSNTNEAAAATSTIGFASSNASIGVIGGLAALFLILIGLFAYTSRPRPRKRWSRRHYLNDDDDDDDIDLNSCQYNDKYDNELDAVSALVSGKQSAASWWQEPVRVTSDYSVHSSSIGSAMMDTIPTVEACYSNEGVVVGNDEDELTAEIESSPKVLPLSFFRKKSKSSRDDETDGSSSTFVKLEDDDDDETVDMDAHLFGGVEDSKPKKSRQFVKRLFGKKSDDATTAAADDDIVIQEIQSRATTQDDDEIFIEETFAHEAFGIETTRASSLRRPMPKYSSPTTAAGRMLQSCSSGAHILSNCLPAPEIGDDASNISALTDNYYDQYSGRRSPPPLMRLATDVVSQCIAPTTTDHASVSTRSVSRRQQRQQQLARRGKASSNAMDPFADCWNPFEGSFWRGWFE